MNPEPSPAGPLSYGADLIKAERLRQKREEGWSEDHDAEHHWSGELLDAGMAYAEAAAAQGRGESYEFLKSAVSAGEIAWPWEDDWWNPSEDEIRNLVKAGALIAAEIDRLYRAKQESLSTEPAP